MTAPQAHNPYTPPSAGVADAVSEEPAPPKPIAVTIAQVIGVVAAAALAWVMTRYAIAFLEWQKFGSPPPLWFLELGIRVAIFAAVALMLYELPRRTELGRWCGVLMILAILTFPIYLLVTMQPEDTATPWALFGFVLGFLVTSLPVVYWLYAFAFSRKARAYFRGPARN